MTDPQLIGLARQALNMMKTAMERGHRGILLANYYEGEGVHRMDRVEKILADLLGEDWLDHGGKKDAAFMVLRKATEVFPQKPDAIIIVTASNMFKPTEKMQALPLEKQKKLINQGHDRHHKLAAEGYLKLIDSFTALVQTPERACISTQEVDGQFFVGQPDTRCLNQAEFGGRLKMFGEDPFEKERKATQ